MNGSEGRSGRDARLLGLVIIVSLLVLLVLARFRFPPSAGAPAAPTPGPLERLTARSTYDDLAATIANVVQRVSSSVVVLQLGLVMEGDKSGTAGKARPAEPVPAAPRLVPALRVGQDLAVAHLPAGFEVTAGQGLAAPAQTAATDPRREIALVRAPSVFDLSNGLTNALDDFAGWSYVAVVEAAIGGLTATPVFIGRVDVITESAWAGPVRVVGGTPPIPVGALVFTLDGRFVGLAVPGAGGGRTLVPGAAIDTAVVALSGGRKGGSP